MQSLKMSRNTCATSWYNHRDEEDKDLTNNHMQAICVYTSDYKKFYKTFNDAARTERKTYGTTFKFHSLHFCLTSAAQMLNNNKNYNITYHRTNDVFTGKVKKINQFGSFTSTSFRADLSQFGTKTCFKIKAQVLS